MAILTSRVSWLREKIAANRELASKMEQQLELLEDHPSRVLDFPAAGADENPGLPHPDFQARLKKAPPDRSQFVPLMESRPYGVNLYGFFRTVSGLGSVARSFTKGLETAAIPFQKIAIPSWAEQVSKRSLPVFEPHRVNLILQNPDMLPLFFAAYGTDLLKGCYNIGYWLWELASVRPDWIPLYRYVDEIWVASEFCRLTFQSATSLPVKRIPPVVDGLEKRITHSREHFGLPRDRFVFGYIFDLASYFERKNPLCLVEAFRREFGDSRDVLLCLKYLNAGRDEPNVRALQEAIAGASNIRTFSGTMDGNEIVSLQNSFDCLVSPHRSEGFGYNLAEAMYLAKPVIATRYSSNLDFMREDNSYLIDCSLVPIPLSQGPYQRGQFWAEPSIDHLCHLMRTVFEDSPGRAEKGRRAADEIRVNYSAAAVSRQIASRLEEIGLRAPRLSGAVFGKHEAVAAQPRPRHLSHKRYPPFAMKVAARLRAEELGLARPDYDALSGGGLARLFREHLRAARRPEGPQRSKVVRHWHRAVTSATLDIFRPKPKTPPEFDEVPYLLVHPDVALRVAAGDFRSGYEHWLRFGKQEGRLAHFRESPSPSSKRDIPAGFDEDAYLFLNPDVAAAVDKGLFPSGYRHWVVMGRKEQRGGGPWEPVPDRSQSIELLQSRPFGVNLYGFLSTISGVGASARSFGQALDAARIPFQGISIPSWEDRNARRALPDFDPYRVNLLVQNPDMLPRFARAYGTDPLKGCYNIGYWAWELPSPRSDWFHLYRYVDEIWVGCEFVRDAFQALTKLPVKRMALAVDGIEKQAIYSREHFGLPRGVFVFGYVFDVASHFERKNPLCLVEAFRREFGHSPGVLLYLKYLNADRDQNNVRLLEEAIAGAPNIRTYSGMMDENEIISLQNSIDCLVSPHRGEGFGYNMAEAMYLGKPVIATRYSANLDFMREDNSYLIDCTLVPIPATIGPYLHGHLWADPSVSHLRRLMRTVFEDSAGRDEKGRRAAQEIRKNYSAQAAGKRISDRLEEIGLQRPQLSAALFHSHGAGGQPRLLPEDTPAAIAREIRAWGSKPVVSLTLAVHNMAADSLRRRIESIRSQYYPFWELCLCDNASTSEETIAAMDHYRGSDPRIKITRLERKVSETAASERAREFATGDHLVHLEDDPEFAPDALYRFVQSAELQPSREERL